MTEEKINKEEIIGLPKMKGFYRNGKIPSTKLCIKKEKFKINDLVEVPKWRGYQWKPFPRDWIIIDFASNGNKVIIRNIFSRARNIVLLSDLKHQKKEE